MLPLKPDSIHNLIKVISFIRLCRLRNIRQTRRRSCKQFFESRRMSSVSKWVESECRLPVIVSFTKQSVFPLNQNVQVALHSAFYRLGCLFTEMSLASSACHTGRHIVHLCLSVFCLTSSSSHNQVVYAEREDKSLQSRVRIRTEDNAFYTDSRYPLCFVCEAVS